MFMGTVAKAAWTEPVIVGEVPTPGTNYYIMNTEAKQFLNAAKVWFSWSTSAGLDANGTTFQLVANGEGAFNFQNTGSHNGKYVFISGNGADANGEMHVDGASPTAFVLVPSNGNAYKIANVDETLGYWGWPGAQANWPNAVNCYLQEGAIEWVFVTPEEKEAFSPKMAAYLAAQELEAVIAEASALGIDVAEEQAVYDNEESTAEELKASIEPLKIKIINKKAEAATYDNPVDMSARIINATFDVIGDFHGWSGSSFGADGSKDKCAERYQIVYDTWQEITDMPVGVYKVNADGFYRAGGAADGFIAEKNQNNYNSVVYGANMVEGEQADFASANIMHIAHGIPAGNPDNLGGVEVTFEGESYKVPNSMVDFVNYNNKGYYKTNEVLFPVSEGTLRIGSKSFSATGWTILDNFGLTYYGNGADAWAALTEDFKKNAALSENALVTVSLKEKYNGELAALNATNYEEYSAAAKAISEARVEIDENTAAWNAYIAEGNKAKLLIADPKYADIAKDLADYLAFDYSWNTTPGDQDYLSLSTEEVKAETEKLTALYNEAKALTPVGTDVTGMLTNPDFAQGWTGWEHKGTGGNVAANAAAHCAEAWNAADFDIHQDINDAPVGVYEISVQGFYRYGRGDNAWNAYYNADGTPQAEPIEYIKNTPARIYANDNTTAMANVFDFKVAKDDNIYTGDFYTDPNGEYVYPNNMTDAGKAFDLGAYKVSTYGLVAKKGDPLRVGIKGNSTQLGDSWAIFTRFKMVFQGFKADIIQPALDTELTNIDMSKPMGANVIEKATAAVANGSEALATGDGKTMFDALAEILAVKEEVSTSIALFETLAAKMEELAEAMNTFDSPLIEEAGELYGTIQAGIDEQTLTDEGAAQAMNDIDEMIGKLQLPEGIVDATDENPFDCTELIINNGFELGDLTGWTVAANTVDTGAKNNVDPYTTEGIVGDYLLNTWSSSAPEGGFFVKQTIGYLPAGTYTLSVLCATDNDNKITVFGNDSEYEFVATDGGGIFNTVELTFKMENAGKLELGTKSGTWYKNDEFTLMYYGAESTKELGGKTTGIVEAASDAAAKYVKVAKFFKNGKFYIVKDGKVYSVAGAQVK